MNLDMMAAKSMQNGKRGENERRWKQSTLRGGTCAKDTGAWHVTNVYLTLIETVCYVLCVK